MDDSKTHPGEPVSSRSGESDSDNGWRSTRLLVAVPITLTGQNARGETFREEARTIVIHLQGATIATSQPFAPGSEINVENPPLRTTVRARVTRYLEKASSADFHRIDVELAEPRNIWGIKYPPADWKKAPASAISSYAAASQSQLSGTARPNPAAQPVSSELPPLAATQRLRAEPLDLPAGSAAGHFALTSQHQALAAELEAAKFLDSAGREGGAGERLPSSLAAAITHLEEQENAVLALDRRLAEAATRAEKSAVHLEELASKVDEVCRQAQTETEQARKSVHEAVQEAFQTVRHETDKNLSQELESMRSGFLEETRRMAADQVSALSLEFKQQVGGSLSGVVEERLANATGELQARQSRTVEDTEKQLGKLLDTSFQNFQQQLQEGAQSLRESALSNVAQEGAARVALEYESKKTEVAEQVAAKAQEIIGSALEGFQAQLRQSAEELRNSTAAAIAEESAAKVAAGIQARQTEIASQTEVQLRTAARTEIENLQAQLRQSAEELRNSTAAEIAEESAAKVAAKIQARQTEIAGQAEVQLRAAARTEIENLQAQLRQSAEELRNSTAARIAEESAAKVGEAIRVRQAEIASQLESQIQGAIQSGLDAVQTRMQQAEQTLRDSALPALTQECVAKSMAAAETSQSALVERTRTQMQSIMVSSVEGFEAESARAAEQFRESVLPGLAKECAAATAEEMRHAQRDAVLQATEQIQNVLQSTLSGFGEQLRSSAQTLSQKAEDLLQLPARQINQCAEEAVARVQERTSSLRAGEVEAAQIQLAAMTRGALTSMSEEVKATTEEYREQLRAILEGLRERSAAAVEGYIKEALDHSRESVMQQLQKDAEDFTSVAVAQFRNRSGEAVREATEAIHKQVGSAAFVVKDWLDQAAQQMDARAARLEARSDSALEAIDHRSEDFSRAVLDKFQKESDAVLAGLRMRIQNAVRALEAPEPAIPSMEVHPGSAAQQPRDLPVPSPEG